MADTDGLDDIRATLADITARLARIERAVIAEGRELTKPAAVVSGYSSADRARADAADAEWADVQRAYPDGPE